MYLILSRFVFENYDKKKFQNSIKFQKKKRYTFFFLGLKKIYKISVLHSI